MTCFVHQVTPSDDLTHYSCQKCSKDFGEWLPEQKKDEGEKCGHLWHKIKEAHWVVPSGPSCGEDKISAPKEEQKGCYCDPQFCHLCSKCPCSCHKSLQYPDSTGIGYCPSKSDFPQEKEDSCSTEPCLKDCKHEFGIERYDSNGILQYKECGICFKRQSPLKDYYTKSEIDERMKALLTWLDYSVPTDHIRLKSTFPVPFLSLDEMRSRFLTK